MINQDNVFHPNPEPIILLQPEQQPDPSLRILLGLDKFEDPLAQLNLNIGRILVAILFSASIVRVFF